MSIKIYAFCIIANRINSVANDSGATTTHVHLVVIGAGNHDKARAEAEEIANATFPTEQGYQIISIGHEQVSPALIRLAAKGKVPQ